MRPSQWHMKVEIYGTDDELLPRHLVGPLFRIIHRLLSNGDFSLRFTLLCGSCCRRRLLRCNCGSGEQALAHIVCQTLYTNCFPLMLTCLVFDFIVPKSDALVHDLASVIFDPGLPLKCSIRLIERRVSLSASGRLLFLFCSDSAKRLSSSRQSRMSCKSLTNCDEHKLWTVNCVQQSRVLACWCCFKLFTWWIRSWFKVGCKRFKIVPYGLDGSKWTRYPFGV